MSLEGTVLLSASFPVGCYYLEPTYLHNKEPNKQPASYYQTAPGSARSLRKGFLQKQHFNLLLREML